jgi:hypothetical protein
LSVSLANNIPANRMARLVAVVEGLPSVFSCRGETRISVYLGAN